MLEYEQASRIEIQKELEIVRVQLQQSEQEKHQFDQQIQVSYLGQSNDCVGTSKVEWNHITTIESDWKYQMPISSLMQ